MAELEKVIIWLKYDYLPRVGAYRKDCKQGCDACMPLHDGDNYCDIDMLCKILAVLKEQEAMNVDAFVQWCIDSHIMGDATVRGIKFWVGKYKEFKER